MLEATNGTKNIQNFKIQKAHIFDVPCGKVI